MLHALTQDRENLSSFEEERPIMRRFQTVRAESKHGPGMIFRALKDQLTIRGLMALFYLISVASGAAG
ncbi:MAG: hypothetical protein ACMUIM_00990 [bacterium]